MTLPASVPDNHDTTALIAEAIERFVEVDRALEAANARIDQLTDLLKAAYKTNSEEDFVRISTGRR